MRTLSRSAVRDGTKRGREAKSYMDRGDLVPDSVILGILQDVMTSPATKKGAILDGAVRTVPQAEGLGVTLAEIGKMCAACRGRQNRPASTSAPDAETAAPSGSSRTEESSSALAQARLTAQRLRRPSATTSPEKNAGAPSA